MIIPTIPQSSDLPIGFWEDFLNFSQSEHNFELCSHAEFPINIKVPPNEHLFGFNMPYTDW